MRVHCHVARICGVVDILRNLFALGCFSPKYAYSVKKMIENLMTPTVEELTFHDDP